MKEPLAGKRWFYAAGASCKARGLSLSISYKIYGMRQNSIHPAWAVLAFNRGWCEGKDMTK